MDKALEQRFIETLRNHLVTLPFDLKVLYEAKDDPNLERGVRETVCGAILYILHTQESNERILGRSDDVVMLRLVLAWVRAQGGADEFCERFGELFGALDEDLATYKSALGGTYAWLESKVGELRKQVHRAKKVVTYLDDDDSAEMLYEDGLEFGTNYEITEEQIQGRLKQSKPVLDYLERKKQLDSMRIT